MRHILVTGASGFVGRALIKKLADEDYPIRATYHDNKPEPGHGKERQIEWIRVDFENKNDYAKLLDDIEVVVHLAAKVHIADNSEQALATFRKANSSVTRLLAEEAAKKGVKRFVYISTVKVHGEKTMCTHNGRYQRFTETDQCNPEDPYAISKLEAEHAISEICRKNPMEYVILRPPLLYGPFVKANFLSLIDTIATGIPLPLASIHNLRSFLYVGNLCHAIMACIRRPEASNQVYLISDIDISLPDLINKIALLLGTKSVLFSFPVSLLKMAGQLTGGRKIIDRLTESLLLDNSKLARELQWVPPVTFEEGLEKTIDWYRNCH